MKNRKKIKGITWKSTVLSKRRITASSPETGDPFSKLTIKIFSASKYTPTYIPTITAIRDPENGIVLVESNNQGLKDNQVVSENDQVNWQEVISTANLSVRARNVLLMNFSSCDQFLSCNGNTLGDLRNCGRKTIRELVEFQGDMLARKGEASKPNPEVWNHPRQAEDVLKLPPSGENIPILPIFNSRRLTNFTVADLHQGFNGTTRLQDFAFSVRASKIFRQLGLETIGEVMLFPSSELLLQKNFGRKCLKEVQNVINSFIQSGDITQTSAITLQSGGRQPAVDYSSYENLVASFVRHCLKTKRNQAIVCNRLDFSGDMLTLEQLGERFGITRERIRQVLKRGNALLSVKAYRELLADFWELVVKIISEGGGIISLQDLAESICKEYGWPSAPNPPALAELLVLAEEDGVFFVSGGMVTIPSCPCIACETAREHLPALDFEASESYHVLVVGDKLARQCRNHCHLASPRIFHKTFIEKLVDDSGSAYRLHEGLVFPQERWLVRHGERLEDLIVQVLKTHGSPMHFSEIAAAIRKGNIKHQEISDHNIHSAMLRYDTVEIVQRGTYGLKVWGVGGYRSVSTAIEDLLDVHDLPMRRSDIIKRLAGEFSEQNISAALHSWGNRFLSIGEGFYDRPERWRKRSMPGLINLLPDALANLARYITTNNNCSYKLVLALVFIRGMDEKGTYYLPTLKERFLNFYLGRYRKGELVEAENVLVQRIGEMEPGEIRNKIIKEPLKNFLSSNFWHQKYSSLYIDEGLVSLLVTPEIHNLLLIILLKGIYEYFAMITPTSSKYPTIRAEVYIKKGEAVSCSSESTEEEIMNVSSENTLSITIKKKSRGKISL